MVAAYVGFGLYDLNDSGFYALRAISNILNAILNVSMYSLCVIMNVIYVIMTFIIKGFALQSQAVFLVWDIWLIRIFQSHITKLNSWN